jgi:hypothetical protein
MHGQTAARILPDEPTEMGLDGGKLERSVMVACHEMDGGAAGHELRERPHDLPVSVGDPAQIRHRHGRPSIPQSSPRLLPFAVPGAGGEVECVTEEDEVQAAARRRRLLEHRDGEPLERATAPTRRFEIRAGSRRAEV